MFDTQDIREAACMPAYNALVVFVIIYTFSWLIIWPTKARWLPYDVRTLDHLGRYVRHGGTNQRRGH